MSDNVYLKVLAEAIMQTDLVQQPRFVLFYQFNRKDAWRVIAAATTTAELVDVMSRGSSGEYQDVPFGVYPAGKCETLDATKLAEITILSKET